MNHQSPTKGPPLKSAQHTGNSTVTQKPVSQKLDIVSSFAERAGLSLEQACNFMEENLDLEQGLRNYNEHPDKQKLQEFIELAKKVYGGFHALRCIYAITAHPERGGIRYPEPLPISHMEPIFIKEQPTL